MIRDAEEPDAAGVAEVYAAYVTGGTVSFEQEPPGEPVHPASHR